MQRIDRALTEYDNASHKEAGPPLRLLALNGGGVRGLSETIILKHLMRNISKKCGRNIEPWERFDMIGGTSTGGLIAIMLGRLVCPFAIVKLPICNYPKVYSTQSVPSSTLPREPRNPSRKWQIRRTTTRGRCQESYRGELQSRRKRAAPRPRLQMPCIVVATRVRNSQLAVLRSYDSEMPETLFDDCKVWEACRATSAAPTFFDAVKIGPYEQELMDGGLLYNNPIQLLRHEAASVWSDRVHEAIYASIGTENASGGSFEGNLKSIVESMKDTVTQTERISDDFCLAHPDIVQRSACFRFNVFHGLADVGLAEYEEKAKIADSTQSYLSLAETQQKTKSCVDRLFGDARPGKDQFRVEAWSVWWSPFSRSGSMLIAHRYRHNADRNPA